MLDNFSFDFDFALVLAISTYILLFLTSNYQHHNYMFKREIRQLKHFP